MSWQAGAYRKFQHKPTDEEISAAKKRIAEELMKAIEESDFIVKPFGHSGEWTVGCKITFDGNEPDRQEAFMRDAKGENSMKSLQELNEKAIRDTYATIEKVLESLQNDGGVPAGQIESLATLLLALRECRCL